MAAALATAQPPLTASAGDRARTADVETTVRFLAAPELAGRAAGEPGGDAAAAYIAARLAALGWLPAGDAGPDGPSYYQSVAAVSARFVPGESFVAASWPAASPSGATRTVRLQLGQDAVCVPDRSESVAVEGDLVFAGFGIRAPEYQHDDYAKLDPHGKVVLVLSGEPGEQDSASAWNGARPTRHSSIAAKRTLAGLLGAVALLVVPNPAGRAKSAAILAGGAPIDDEWLGLSDSSVGVPAIYLNSDVANGLLEGSGLDLRSATEAAPRVIEGRKVSVHLAYRDRRDRALHNVLARLGAGSGLEGEAILLGAHWDHLGRKGGAIHPGADDNASGIAGLLEVAQELQAELPKGKREVILAAWTGEEEGLLGSTYFTQHPPLPLERLTAAINLDMLGRDNMDKAENARVLQVIYSAGAPVLRAIATAANAGVGFDLRFYPSLRFHPISDHYAFHQAGVPIVYPFSGYHADYHEATDVAGKVRFERVLDAARFVARLIRGLAAHEGAIRLDPAIQEAPAPDPFETPYGG